MARATSLQPGLCKIRGTKTTRSIPSANDHQSLGHSQYSPTSRWHCVSRHVECVLLWSVGTSPKSLIYYVGSLCQALANSSWQKMTVNKQHLPIHQSSVFDLQHDSNIPYTVIIRRITLPDFCRCLSCWRPRTLHRSIGQSANRLCSNRSAAAMDGNSQWVLASEMNFSTWLYLDGPTGATNPDKWKWKNSSKNRSLKVSESKNRQPGSDKTRTQIHDTWLCISATVDQDATKPFTIIIHQFRV